MQEKDVPDAWVDAAMTGADPGCRMDARAYLANAYETIRDDLLWELVERDMHVTCACGMEWEPNAYQGPDHGHGRYACPAGAVAVLRIGAGEQVSEFTIRSWRYRRLMDQAGQTGRRLITGWLSPDFDPRTEDVKGAYARNARLVWVRLPGGQQCPIGQKVGVEMTGYGDGNGLFLKVSWHDKSWE